MGLRDSWNELGTGGKVLVGLAVGGVVLVVGLVVLLILAAVVGSFVLGMGDTAETTMPQASFTVDYDASNETAEITHSGGESIPASGLDVETGERTVEWDDGDGDVTAGDSMTVDANRGTTVRVIWRGDGESAVLSRTTLPE